MVKAASLFIATGLLICITTSYTDGGLQVVNYPAGVLNLTNWKLNIPLDDDKDGKSDEIKQPGLSTYAIEPWFHTNKANDGVVFRAHCGGATTNGSGFPRSELREMTHDGKKAAGWSSDTGTHIMEIEQAVTHLPNAKPHIVVGQIHDASDDVIVFRLEGKKLFIDHNGEDGALLTGNYELGTRFNVKFEVQNDQVRSYYNNTLIETWPVHFTGAYFKAGAYVQSSCQRRKKVAGELCEAYGEVVIYKVSVTHR